MRNTRAAVAVVTIIGLSALIAVPAGAASPGGVGSATSSATVFSLLLGSSDPAATSAPVLGVNLSADSGSATIDPSVSGPAAVARLAGLASTAPVRALTLTVPAQPVQAQAPGGQPSVSTPAVDLGNVAGVSVPASLATGGIAPATLAASAAPTGAHATVAAGLSGVSLAGGLVSVGPSTSRLSDDAVPTSSSSTRTVQVGPVTVVGIAQLLAGLGIPLTDRKSVV